MTVSADVRWRREQRSGRRRSPVAKSCVATSSARVNLKAAALIERQHGIPEMVATHPFAPADDTSPLPCSPARLSPWGQITSSLYGLRSPFIVSAGHAAVHSAAHQEHPFHGAPPDVNWPSC